MYYRILVPLDGSPRAEQILRHVEGLALTSDSHVLFLQVVRPEVVSDGYKSILIQQSGQANLDKIQEAENYLAQLADRFREKGIKTQTAVEVGPVVDTILRVAEREAADLIAMASHGRSGLSRVFYGSVAAGVLQSVDRPLLLVRSRQTP